MARGAIACLEFAQRWGPELEQPHRLKQSTQMCLHEKEWKKSCSKISKIRKLGKINKIRKFGKISNISKLGKTRKIRKLGKFGK